MVEHVEGKIWCKPLAGRVSEQNQWNIERKRTCARALTQMDKHVDAYREEGEAWREREKERNELHTIVCGELAVIKDASAALASAEAAGATSTSKIASFSHVSGKTCKRRNRTGRQPACNGTRVCVRSCVAESTDMSFSSNALPFAVCTSEALLTESTD
eukprot:2675675-Pleurochrysis_carterae.AAC.1